MELSLTEKETIGKYASKHRVGVAAVVKEFDKKNLKESSVRDWQDAYLKDFKEKSQEAKSGEKVVVTALSSKKRGRPVLLGSKLDETFAALTGWDESKRYICWDYCSQGHPHGGGGGGGGQLGHFAPGPSLKGAPGGPMKGPLNTCLKDRYTLIEQSDLNTLIEQSQNSSEKQCSKLIDKEIWLVRGRYCHC